MFLRTIAFLAAVLALENVPRLPGLEWFALALLLPIGFRWPRLILLSWFLAGFLWALGQAHWRMESVLTTELEQQNVEVEGVVASIPEFSKSGWKFRFDVDRAWQNGHEIEVPSQVLLSWYDPASEIHAGEQWHWTVRMKRPWGTANLGGFDYEAWLIHQGFGATGNVVGKAETLRISSLDYRYALQVMRESLRDWMLQLLPQETSPVASGVLLALMLGDQSAISAEHWAIFQRTGTSHLIAISGSHIALLAGFAFFLLRRLWSLSPALCRHLPAQKAASIAAFLIGLMYALLAGFGIPVQRALLMLAVVAFAQLRDQESNLKESLSWAVLLVLFYDPAAVHAPGFWLSVGAVALIAYQFRPGSKNNWVSAFWLLQWPMFIFLIPLQAIFFGQFSIVSPLVNFVAIPLIELLLVPLAFLLLFLSLFSMEIATQGFRLWQWMFNLLWQVLSWTSDFHWATFAVSTENTLALNLAFGLALLGVIWLLLPKGFPNRFLGWLLIAPLLFMPPQRPKANDYWLSVLDVGQGLAVMVETEHHLLIYDTGASFASGFDFGDAVLLPWLRARGYREVDLLMVSHGDNDHIGGADSLIQAMKVQQVSTSVPERFSKSQAGFCLSDTQWNWDGVTFTILHPSDYGIFSENNLSCVLRIQSAGGVVLIPGDLEKEGERQLLLRSGAELNADILLVPHHGSKTSSTVEFLAAVSPQVAIVSAGRLNRFHHPAKSIVERYDGQQIPLYNTAQWGMVQFQIRARDGIGKPQLEREKNRHYWNVAP